MGIEIKPRKSLVFRQVAAANPDLALSEQANLAGITTEHARHLRAETLQPERPHKFKSAAKSD